MFRVRLCLLGLFTVFTLALLGRAGWLVWRTDIAPCVATVRAALALTSVDDPVQQELQPYVVGTREEVSLRDGPKVAELIGHYYPMVNKQTQAVLVTYQEVGFSPELHLVMEDDDGRRAVSFAVSGITHLHVSTRHPQVFTLARR